MGTVTLWHGDCIKLMKDIPDGYFNIAKKRIEAIRGCNNVNDT